MRSLFILLFVLLFAGGVYLAFNPELLDELPDPAAALPGDMGFLPSKEGSPIYKWLDARGQWQVSDQPPPAGVEYEILQYRKDANVLPLPPALKKAQEQDDR